MNISVVLLNISVVLGPVLHVLYDPTGSVPHVLYDPGELWWSVYAVLHVVLGGVLIPGDNLLEYIFNNQSSYCYLYMNIVHCTVLTGPKIFSGTLVSSTDWQMCFFFTFSCITDKMNENLKDYIITWKKCTESLVYIIDNFLTFY